MKRIPLRVLPDPLVMPGTPDYEASLIRWSDIIRQCIRRPLDPQRGVDVDEMRRGIRVLDAIDHTPIDGEVLELEDADWDHLAAKVRAMQWAIVDKRILLFIEDVLQASELSPNGVIVMEAKA